MRKLSVLSTAILICTMISSALARDDKAPATQPARGWLGCKLSPNEDGKGIVVVEVLEKSPAAAAGLQEKDVLTKIDGKEIDDIQSFIARMRQSRVGEQVNFTVMRDKEEKQIAVTFGEVPANMATTQEKPAKHD